MHDSYAIHTHFIKKRRRIGRVVILFSLKCGYVKIVNRIGVEICFLRQTAQVIKFSHLFMRSYFVARERLRALCRLSVTAGLTLISVNPRYLVFLITPYCVGVTISIFIGSIRAYDIQQFFKKTAVYVFAEWIFREDLVIDLLYLKAEKVSR